METGMRARTTMSLLTVGAIFGSSFLFVKLLVGEVSPLQITAWRLLFGGGALALMLAGQGRLRAPAASLVVRAGVLALLDSIIPNTLLAWAQIRIDSGVAAVLISTMPLFTVVFAMALPRTERISMGKAGGIAFGLAGVAVLVGADVRSASNGAPIAHLAVVGAAMCNAAAVIYARALLANEDAMQLSAVKLLLGALLAMSITAVVERGHTLPPMNASAWSLLLVLGVLSNALGRTLYLSVIATAGSVRASLVAYVVPVVGVLLGWLVLGERMNLHAAAGITMIALGMASVTHGALVAGMLSNVWGHARRPRTAPGANTPAHPTLT